MNTIFKEDYLECYHDEENNVLMHIWTRKPSSEEFRAGLINVHRNYVKFNNPDMPLHWLGDTRKMGVLGLEDQAWLDAVWNRMLFVEAGVKAHAVIVGADVFAKYAMEKFNKAMQEEFSAQKVFLDTFENKEKAYDWFKSVEDRRAAS